MKNTALITRASLLATATRHANLWFFRSIAGAGILGTSCVLAGTWTGAVSTDWNNSAGNWSGGNGSTAQVNSVPANIATVSANLTTIPTQIIVGNTTTGRVNHVSGDASVATGNDLVLGRSTGGNGTYNLANTAATGGSLTGFGQGSGNLTIPDQIFVGGALGAATGVLNIHTTGTLSIGTQLLVGSFGGTGTMKMDSGTITVTNDIEVGNGTGSTGTFSMSGGSVTKSAAATAVTIGGGLTTDGGTGTANLNGGSFTAAGVFRVGQDTIATSAPVSTGTLNLGGTNLTVNGEFWVGNNTGATGTLNFSSGSLTTNNWAIIGRKDNANTGVGATGSATMTGGTWTKSGESNFVVGDTGQGTMNMSGGLVIVTPHTTADRGITWIGNRNNCIGTLTISGAAEFRSSRFVLGVEGGAGGTLNLNGGTVKTTGFAGGAGNAAVHFNGTQIIATGDSINFISQLDTATIETNGLLLDTAGFNLTVPQGLDGTGGIVKSGVGSLTLSGLNTYTGNHVVNVGKLVVSSDSVGIGSFTVANGATMAVVKTFDSTLSVPNVTLGATGAASLDIDLGNTFGNPLFPALHVAGNLVLNGPITVNIADEEPEVGSFPLITYATPKTGSGNFVLGDLPDGVAAVLTDDGAGTVTLEITSLSFPKWNGNVSSVWDSSTLNWVDMLSSLSTAYVDPLPVVFDDSATGPTAVTLNTTVAPSSVTFSNFTLPYSLTGTGKITGSAGLTKEGIATLALETTNDYTGPTVLAGGVTTVTSIANAGSPSSIGASSAAPSNLVMEGGKLVYNGPAVVSNRGFTIAAAETEITNANNLTFGGQVIAPTGNLVKSGAGDLTLSHNGANVLGANNQIIRVHAGRLILSGGGAQTNLVAGELWVADLPDSPADLILENTSLTTTNWLTIGRGNGDSGVSNLNITNSTVQTVNFSTGFNNNLTNNASESFVNVHNSIWTNSGLTYLAESTGSTATMTMTGTSQYNINNTFLLARFDSTTATFTMEDNSSITKTGGYASIGSNGNAVMNIRDNASFTATNNDFNIGDVGFSTGILNLSDSGAVNVTNIYIGKGNGTQGTLNQSGGTFQSASFINIGRYAGTMGIVNLSAGTFNSSGLILIGDEGAASLNVSGSATVTCNGDAIFIGNQSTGNGILNLNGGTVIAKRVAEGITGGTSTVNFNGGTLRAATGATVAFLTGLNNANILAGGAIIDTNGQNLTIAQNLGGTGGFTKSGTGALTLSGTNTYSGSTTVSAGTLSLASASLSNTSPVTIATGAVLNLPHGLTDQVSSLVIGGTTLGVGTYDAVSHPAAITGTGKIQVTGSASAYDTWIGGYPSIPLADRDPGDDPDADGSSNAVEFALGGVPNSGSSRPKVYSLIADSSADGDAINELLMTVAVRSGTPAFAGSPSPTATHDGISYSIEGSTTLAPFPTAAAPVTPVVAGLPAAPAGYEYRTFSLSGSNGTTNKGFLRVKIGY